MSRSARGPTDPSPPNPRLTLPRLNRLVGKGSTVPPRPSTKSRVQGLPRYPIFSRKHGLVLPGRGTLADFPEPSRKYLWISSRTEKMDDNLYAEITGRLAAKGYDATKLERVRQTE